MLSAMYQLLAWRSLWFCKVNFFVSTSHWKHKDVIYWCKNNLIKQVNLPLFYWSLMFSSWVFSISDKNEVQCGEESLYSCLRPPPAEGCPCDYEDFCFSSDEVDHIKSCFSYQNENVVVLDLSILLPFQINCMDL